MDMNLSIAMGIILLAGAGGGKLARYLKLPSVTGNLIAGILIGPSVLHLVSADMLYRMAPVNELALGVIALSIGAELQWRTLRNLAHNAAKVFFVEAILTFTSVFLLLLLVGQPFPMALVFGILSIATAPGAIIACLRETPIKGNFSKVLLTVVALDNLLAIIFFGVAISFLQVTQGAGSGAGAFLLALQNIGLSLILGVAAGIGMVAIARYAKSDGRILVTVLGVLFLTVGFAAVWDVPALLAAIAAGAFYTNFAHAPQRVSRSLYHVEGPILLAFLTMAGVKLDVSALPSVGFIGLVYILARFGAKLLGSRIGASFTDFPNSWKVNLGRALTPQAGVAIGLAIIAEQKLPFADNRIITVVLGAVVVFELIGPILVRRALCSVDKAA